MHQRYCSTKFFFQSLTHKFTFPFLSFVFLLTVSLSLSLSHTVLFFPISRSLSIYYTYLNRFFLKFLFSHHMFLSLSFLYHYLLFWIHSSICESSFARETMWLKLSSVLTEWKRRHTYVYKLKDVNDLGNDFFRTCHKFHHYLVHWHTHRCIIRAALSFQATLWPSSALEWPWTSRGSFPSDRGCVILRQ